MVKDKLDRIGEDNYRVVYQNDDVLVIETFLQEAITSLGGDWCIVNNPKQWFNNYVNPGAGNTQYLAFDFTKLPTDPNSLFGITIDKNGQTASGRCQNRENNYVGEDFIIEELGLPEDIFEPKYKDMPTYLEAYKEYLKNAKTAKECNDVLEMIKEKHPNMSDEIISVMDEKNMLDLTKLIGNIFDDIQDTGIKKGLDTFYEMKLDYPDLYEAVVKSMNKDLTIAFALLNKIKDSKDLPKTTEDFKKLFEPYKEIIKEIYPLGSAMLIDMDNSLERIIKLGKHSSPEALLSPGYYLNVVRNLKKVEDIKTVYDNVDEYEFKTFMGNTAKSDTNSLMRNTLNDNINNIIQKMGGNIKENFEKYPFLKEYYSKPYDTDHVEPGTRARIKHSIDSMLTLKELLDFFVSIEDVMERSQYPYYLDALHDRIYSNFTNITNFKDVYNTIKEYNEKFGDLYPNIFLKNYHDKVIEDLAEDNNLEAIDMEEVFDYIDWLNENTDFELDFDDYSYQIFGNLWKNGSQKKAKEFLEGMKSRDIEIEPLNLAFFNLEHVYEEINSDFSEMVKYLADVFGSEEFEDSDALSLLLENDKAYDKWLTKNGWDGSSGHIIVEYDDFFDDELNKLFDQSSQLTEDYQDNHMSHENYTDWNDTYAPDMNEENKKILTDYFRKAGFDEPEDIEQVISGDDSNDDAYEMVDISEIENAIESAIQNAQDVADADEHFNKHIKTLFEIFDQDFNDQGWKWTDDNRLQLALDIDDLKSMIDEDLLEYIRYEIDGDIDNIDIDSILYAKTSDDLLDYNTDNIYGDIDEDYYNDRLNEELYDIGIKKES
jgi:hypothetical protein